MPIHLTFVIVVALSAAVVVYELQAIASLIWNASEQQVVLNLRTGR